MLYQVNNITATLLAINTNKTEIHNHNTSKPTNTKQTNITQVSNNKLRITPKQNTKPQSNINKLHNTPTQSINRKRKKKQKQPNTTPHPNNKRNKN